MKSNLSIILCALIIVAIAIGPSIVYADSNYQSDGTKNLKYTYFSNQTSIITQPTDPSPISKSLTLDEYISLYSHDTTKGYFEKNDFRQIHSPTVCAVEEDSANNNGKQDLTAETALAVLDWSTKLNEGGGKQGPWHISFKKIPIQDSINFDPSCDIDVRFFSSISSDDSYFVGIKSGGVTYYDSNQHKAYVKILYDGMVLPQIQGVIRHELGHALGLGHYITPEPTIKRITIGLEDSPSIMVGVVPNTNHYSITPLDVSEIKKIYGNEGFQTSEYVQSSMVQKQLITKDILPISNTNTVNNNLYVSDSGKFLSQMIHDDVSDGTSFVGTGSVFVKDLIVEGYLKIPDSINKSHLYYELPLSIRYHIVNSWANGDKSDTELVNELQDMINSGKIDLTKHFHQYDA